MPIYDSFTPAVARRMFDYNPVTGTLTFKPRIAADFAATGGTPPRPSFVRGWNTRHAGKTAGSRNFSGQLRIPVGAHASGTVGAEQLIWYMQYGKWPPSSGPYRIVHINGIRTDNRLSNLVEQYRLPQYIAAQERVDPPAKARTPAASAKLKRAVQQYTAARNKVRLPPSAAPRILHRGKRKAAADYAVRLLAAIAERYPEFAGSERYASERDKWVRWYEHQHFETPATLM
jgi:hypothetical protein